MTCWNEVILAQRVLSTRQDRRPSRKTAVGRRRRTGALPRLGAPWLQPRNVRGGAHATGTGTGGRGPALQATGGAQPRRGLHLRRLPPELGQWTPVALSRLGYRSDTTAGNTTTLPTRSVADSSRAMLCTNLSPYEQKSKFLTTSCQVGGLGSSPLPSRGSLLCGPHTWTVSQLLERVNRPWLLLPRGLACSLVSSMHRVSLSIAQV